MSFKMQQLDLLSHRFSRTFRGYSPREVDDFIQQTVDTIARMSEERLRLMKKLQRLEKQLIAYAEKENSLQKALVASQKVTEEIKLQAQKEAMLIIEAAQTKAERIANQAQVRLAQVEDEIARAQTVKRQFEITIRSTVDSHLKLLEMNSAETAPESAPKAKDTLNEDND